MNIVTILLQNIFGGTRTLRFPDCPPTAPHYRGLVEFDPALCDGCGMCAFVCTSSAIKARARKDTYEWSYDPAQCTFCGRCVDVCAPHNLRMQVTRPPTYTMEGALKKSFTVTRKPPTSPKPSTPVATPAKSGTPK